MAGLIEENFEEGMIDKKLAKSLDKSLLKRMSTFKKHLVMEKHKTETKMHDLKIIDSISSQK